MSRREASKSTWHQSSVTAAGNGLAAAAAAAAGAAAAEEAATARAGPEEDSEERTKGTGAEGAASGEGSTEDGGGDEGLTFDDDALCDLSVVTVRVVCARQLPVMDVRGSSDPYCVLRLGSKEMRTSVKKKCLDPVWEETFRFEVTDDDDQGFLTATVKDRDVLSEDDVIGAVMLPVRKLTPQPWVATHVLGRVSSKQTNVQGLLELHVSRSHVPEVCVHCVWGGRKRRCVYVYVTL